METTGKSRVCVLVPTYNNAKTLATVLTGILAQTSDVIVVNDGSTDSTAAILATFPEIYVVQQPQNMGKGVALRTGFEKVVQLGYTHAITIDSDGQHYPEELPKFFEALRMNENAMVVGARNMDQASVPGKSSFGNKFSNFWYWVETGIRLRDTQSGYRLYPVKALSEIHFYTWKFEFEIEVLVRGMWRGIDVTEVPVKVFYEDSATRVSHFRPFKDFTRIGIVHTVLCTIAIVYIHPRTFFRNLRKKKIREKLRQQLFNQEQSAAVKAFSIGFGIFMGIFPVWGFQLLIAIPLAILFRLNTVLVVLAAHISIPPMIPVILFLSHLTGKIWMGADAQHLAFNTDLTLEVVKNNLEQYFLGAITLALGAGLIFGAASYLGLILTRRMKT